MPTEAKPEPDVPTHPSRDDGSSGDMGNAKTTDTQSTAAPTGSPTTSPNESRNTSRQQRVVRVICIAAIAAIVVSVGDMAYKTLTAPTPGPTVRPDAMTALTNAPNPSPNLLASAKQSPSDVMGSQIGGKVFANEPAGLTPFKGNGISAKRLSGVRRARAGFVEEIVQWIFTGPSNAQNADSLSDQIERHYADEARKAGYTAVKKNQRSGQRNIASRSRVYYLNHRDTSGVDLILTVRVSPTEQPPDRGGPPTSDGASPPAKASTPTVTAPANSTQTVRTTLWLRYPMPIDTVDR